MSAPSRPTAARIIGHPEGPRPGWGHPRHGAHSQSPWELTMTQLDDMPTRSNETDRGFRLTVQLVAPAEPPTPAVLRVEVTDIHTGAVEFAGVVLVHVHDDRAEVRPPVFDYVEPATTRTSRNRMRPVACVFHGVSVGQEERLWAVTGRTSRWRRTRPFTLDCTSAGLEFLLGSRPLHPEAEGAVTTGGPQ